MFASNSDINPRLPGGNPIAKRINAEASEDSPSVVSTGDIYIFFSSCKTIICVTYAFRQLSEYEYGEVKNFETKFFPILSIVNSRKV